MVSFFVVLCYHTIYAAPYIYPPLAFYAFDLFFRMVRTRVKDATLIPIDNQFTIVRLPFPLFYSSILILSSTSSSVHRSASKTPKAGGLQANTFVSAPSSAHACLSLTP